MRYHVTGGLTQGTGHTLQIQANKRFDRYGTASKHLVGTICAEDEVKFKAAAQSIPMQRCQRFTTPFLPNWNRRGSFHLTPARITISESSLPVLSSLAIAVRRGVAWVEEVVARPAGPEELVLLEAEAALRAGAAKHKAILNSMIEAIFNNLSIVFV